MAIAAVARKAGVLRLADGTDMPKKATWSDTAASGKKKVTGS